MSSKYNIIFDWRCLFKTRLYAFSWLIDCLNWVHSLTIWRQLVWEYCLQVSTTKKMSVFESNFWWCLFYLTFFTLTLINMRTIIPLLKTPFLMDFLIERRRQIMKKKIQLLYFLKLQKFEDMGLLPSLLLHPLCDRGSQRTEKGKKKVCFCTLYCVLQKQNILPVQETIMIPAGGFGNSFFFH